MDGTELPNDGPDESGDVDERLTATLQYIGTRAAEIRDAELKQVLETLDTQDELTDAERAELERLATDLVRALLRAPIATTICAAESGDEETVETLLELFAGDEIPEGLEDRSITSEQDETTVLTSRPQDVPQ